MTIVNKKVDKYFFHYGTMDWRNVCGFICKLLGRVLKNIMYTHSLDPGDVELVGVGVVGEGEVCVAHVVQQLVLLSPWSKRHEQGLIAVCL